MGTEFGDDSVSSVSMLEKLADTVSVVTDRTQAASVLLPEGMTEQQAVEVYQQYNFRHEYDANLSITKYREDVSSGILNRFVQDLVPIKAVHSVHIDSESESESLFNKQMTRLLNLFT